MVYRRLERPQYLHLPGEQGIPGDLNLLSKNAVNIEDIESFRNVTERVEI
jgi:hypothetical protein